MSGSTRPAPSTAIALVMAGEHLVRSGAVRLAPGPAGRRRSGPSGHLPARPARRAAAPRPSTRRGGDAADPPGRAAAGVQHETIRRSRSGRQVRTRTLARASGWPPVDRPDVIAEHILAKRVEFAALTSVIGSCGHPVAQLGEFLRQVLAGQERRQHSHVHGACRLRCRPARPRGPSDRSVTAPAVASPRRCGVSVVAPSPAGMAARLRVGCAPALGRQPSRTMPRSRRVPC